MKSALQFDFLVDKEKNTITIKKEFAANRQLIWDCHTKSELLEEWFAPKPYTIRTTHMDFREGGYWFYAMVSPEGQEHWSRLDYLTIKPIDNYTALDGFCNEKGELNPQLPQANWNVTFRDAAGNTRVETIVTYKALKDLETVLQMGLKEGLTMTLEALDELVEKRKK